MAFKFAPFRLRPSGLAGLFLLGFCVCLASASQAEQVPASPTAATPSTTTPTATSNEELRERIEALAAGFQVTAAGEPLMATGTLRQFYQERRFSLAWFRDGRLAPEALELVQTIGQSRAEGLQPGDYHLRLINELTERLSPDSPESDKVALDLLLSDAFVMLGSHLLAGKVDPLTLKPVWSAQRPGLEMAPLLAQALETGSVAAILKTFRPGQTRYQQLRQTRQHLLGLRDTATWETIPGGPLIHPGKRDGRLPLIRSRLIALGDLAASGSATSSGTAAGDGAESYDTALLLAVSRFQARHGLEADGIIGGATLAALNLTPRDRLRITEVNMERWRWLPERPGGTHILVNIADHSLYLVSNEQPVLNSKVRLSDSCEATPVSSTTIDYLVLNPDWTVPPGNPNYTALTTLRADPGFTELGFSLVQGWGAGQKRTNAASINWASVKGEAPGFRLVQDAGRYNALGQIKFMSARGQGPFLHGGPAQGLLAGSAGAVYGCAQVQGAFDLADRLLGQKHGWSRRQVRDATGTEPQPATYHLQAPVPVHIQYLTSWVDSDGLIQVRRDLHNRDAALAQALAQTPP